MAELFGASITRHPPANFDEWMTRYIDHIAREAAMDRKAAEEVVMSAGEDFYREVYEDYAIPEDAADEELLEWYE